MFLSQIEHELFQIPDKCLSYSSIFKEEWQAIRSLAENRFILIKKADRDLCTVIWDRLDYLSEIEKQLGSKNIYKDVSFNDKILRDLVETNNGMFLNLKKKGSVSEKEMKYFVCTIIKMLAILGNSAFFLKFIRYFLIFQVDLSYLIVEPIPKKLLNF